MARDGAITRERESAFPHPWDEASRRYLLGRLLTSRVTSCYNIPAWQDKTSHTRRYPASQNGSALVAFALSHRPDLKPTAHGRGLQHYYVQDTTTTFYRTAISFA